MTQYCGCDSSNTTDALFPGALSCIYDDQLAQEAIQEEASQAICAQTYRVNDEKIYRVLMCRIILKVNLHVLRI